MGSLISSLAGAAGALQAYDRALAVIQSNVTNASTPGYAAARLNMVAQPFDLRAGLSGGVKAGSVESSRDDFVEQSIWRQQNSVGQFTQTSVSLAPLEQVLGVTADAGIPSGLNQLFQSFSQLATAPNDAVQRQQVLGNATQLASSFNAASRDLVTAAAGTDRQVSQTVDQINQIVGSIQNYNQAVGHGSLSRQDAASDASVYANLENLSQLVDFTARRNANGEFDILLGNGQAPLLLGMRQFSLSADFSQPQTGIKSGDGEPVSAQIHSGKLVALLDAKNNLIPGFSADLDRLAQGVADQVNDTLAAGVDLNGNPGQPLFAYDAAAPAATLATTDITPSELAAATAGAPGGSGNAINLAALGNQPALGGSTFSQFYGGLAGRVGQQRASAGQSQQLHQQLLTQAQTVRQQTSGVSLDEEATHLVEFQRAYQAAAQLLTVLSQLTGEVINLLR
jgi:flagellar hook-associated protein 1